MNPGDPIFKGDVAQLGAVDISAPLRGAKAPVCDHYLECYGKAAKQAEAEGDQQRVEIYRFLQVLVGFQLRPDLPAQPFAPIWQNSVGGRSWIPSDLAPSDNDVIRTIMGQTADPDLQARLKDVLWTLTKDVAAGMEAARSYVESADRLDQAETWTYAIPRFRRGIYLAGKFGRGKELFEFARASLIAAAKRTVASKADFHCLKLMQILLQNDLGEPADFAELSASIAKTASETGKIAKVKAYREIEAEWRSRAKDKVGEKAARLASAEAAVFEAEKRIEGPAASYLAGAGLLSDAILELRRAGADRERIAELRQRLTDWQKRSLDEFKTFSTPTVDISELVIAAREHVRHPDLRTAILKLGFGESLSDPRKVREEVIKTADQAPLVYLMGSGIVDHSGRTTANKPGLFGLQGDELEEAIEGECFAHAAQFQWPLRVAAFIQPARVQILNDHQPSFDDLTFIVRNNPFVPEGHETIYLRGLHAGFHGDFLVASHLLTPQVENSLRYVLESNGVDVSNLMSDGTQPVKVLGAIFGVPETKQIFGDSLCFELRGCLIEKTGYDFRNRIAHGFVHEGECYSHAAITVWWLVLRLCLTPFVKRFEENQTGDSETRSGETRESNLPPAP